MPNFFDPIYDPQKDTASSVGEVTDLNPEKIYDVDLRRVDPNERVDVERANEKQEKVAQFMKASRAANAYRQRTGIAEPSIGGRTPRTPLVIDGSPFGGTVLPSLGDSGGKAGSTAYSDKPKAQFGKYF